MTVVVVAPKSLDCRTEKLPVLKRKIRKMVQERIVFPHFIPLTTTILLVGVLWNFRIEFFEKFLD